MFTSYGRLTLLEPEGYTADKVRCKCSCGNTVKVILNSLRTGNTRSCGCLRIEKFIERNTSHNMRHTSEYNAWRSMKARCYNSNVSTYASHGGNGITVCKQWKDSFENFIKDMGNKPTSAHILSRVNANRNYTPRNVIWLLR